MNYRFTEKEKEIYEIAKSLMKLDKGLMVTGSLSAKLMGYHVVKELGDLDVVLPIEVPLMDSGDLLNDIYVSSRDYISNIVKLIDGKKFEGFDAIDYYSGSNMAADSITDDRSICFTVGKGKISIHFLVELHYDSSMWVNTMDINGIEFKLSTMEDMMVRKMRYLFHYGSKKHVKQIISYLEQDIYSLKEKIGMGVEIIKNYNEL